MSSSRLPNAVQTEYTTSARLPHIQASPLCRCIFNAEEHRNHPKLRTYSSQLDVHRSTVIICTCSMVYRILRIVHSCWNIITANEGLTHTVHVAFVVSHQIVNSGVSCSKRCTGPHPIMFPPSRLSISHRLHESPG